MPFDGSVLRGVKTELENTILNGRIDKIYQPEKNSIVIKIRNKGENYNLYISAEPQSCRLHLTSKKYSNPQNPPMFCMLLRKHLQNGKIVKLHQPDYERILEIEVEAVDDAGFLSKKTMVIEIMGKHSNIVLIDEQGIIVDSIKRIPPSMNSYRAVIPREKYVYPPKQGKIDPTHVSAKDFANIIQEKKGELFLAVIKSFNGISPIAAKEICLMANLDPYTNERKDVDLNRLTDAFLTFFETVKMNRFDPTVYKNNDNSKLIDFYVFPLKQLEGFSSLHFPGVSEALDFFYFRKQIVQKFQQKQSDLSKLVKSKLESCYKKLGFQEQQFFKARDAEKFKLYGELLTANIYRLKKGPVKVKLKNYYSSDQKEVEIELDPKLTPVENAQKFFKKYSKLKNTREKVKKQLKNTKAEIEYLESVLYNIEQAAELKELEEIKSELVQEGYIKSNKRISPSKKETTSKPRKFISSDGFTILVGRNNKQNDYLTMKIASSEDIWFHTKHIPGSHVIVKVDGNDSIPETTLLEAAALAAYYSKARQSSNVPIDYTEKKNVKKPRGARPGMVIYNNYKTIYITPSKYTEKIKNMEMN